MKDIPRPVIFGEVLIDRFPDGSEVLGGAPFNVAWNLRGLGLDPLLVSRVGTDPAGDHILDAMRGFGLDTRGIQRDRAHPTGTVTVTLEGGEPAFEIEADQAYDHIDAAELPPLVEEAMTRGLFYHGSLALRSPSSSHAAQVVRRDLEAKTENLVVFFDVNLRDPWWELEQVDAQMSRAHHLKLNEDELTTLRPDAVDTREGCADLLAQGDTQVVVLTRGAEGARVVSREGEDLSVRPAADLDVVDPVGAGDAFASVLILGILRDWPAEASLSRAQEFAGAVVELRGATTTDASFYARFSNMWSSG